MTHTITFTATLKDTRGNFSGSIPVTVTFEQDGTTPKIISAEINPQYAQLITAAQRDQAIKDAKEVFSGK
jgi:hypothetical protein